MAFCVGGIELTSQLKITRNRGKPFVDEVMSRCCHVMIITRPTLAFYEFNFH